MAGTYDQATELLRPTPGNLVGLLRKGYSLRELVYWGVRVKIWSKIRSLLLFSFYSRGSGVDIDVSAVVQGASRIQLGKGVYVQRNAWLAVPLFDMASVEDRPYLVIGDETRIGPACTLSACDRVELGRSVLLGPNVTILDHRHEYRDITRPVSCQGVTSGGKVLIEDNCWLGANSVVFSARGDLVIGKGSVIAANSVVSESVPPYSVVSGNPGKIVRRYNPETKTWDRHE